MFTAVAIAQLAEQGKLAFSDCISRHLPNYPNREVANTVTIHHLLTHTSGLGDYFKGFNPQSWAAKDNLRTVADYFPLFVDDPSAFTPGERWQYSNAGFIVLSGKVDLADAPEVKYAYGFFDAEDNGTRIVGHPGGFDGVNARFDMYLDLGYTAVMLSNYDPPTAEIVADKILEMITPE